MFSAIAQFPGAMLAAGWIDDATRIADKTKVAGVNVGYAAAVVFVIFAYIVRRTLGAVFAALIVAGLVLYGVSNVDRLQKKTEEEINGQQAMAQVTLVAPPVGA